MPELRDKWCRGIATQCCSVKPAYAYAYVSEIDERKRLSEQESFKAFLLQLCLLYEGKCNDVLIWQ